jgi:hypothetical protein
MKTKGINTEQELREFSITVDSEQAMYEVFMKNMITSCYAYGGAEKSSYNFTRFIQKYRDNLTEEVFEEVYREQMEYLKGFEVQSGVYTDAEGNIYNSLKPKQCQTQQDL